MTNQIYNINIPDGPNNPSQDQPKMQTNTNSIKNVLDIDHITFGNNQGGYHQTVHQPSLSTWTQATRTSAPPLTPIVGVNQIISMDVTPVSTVTSTDTQLFSMSGASNGTTNGVYQLTGLNISGGDGYSWAGGILYQWGIVTIAGGIGSVVFKDRFAGAIAFPNAAFIVLTSFANGGSGSVSTSALTNMGFSWARVGSSNFYWFAIGI